MTKYLGRGRKKSNATRLSFLFISIFSEILLNCFNRPDDSVTESLVSMEMETGSSNDDNGLISSEPAGLSEERFRGDGPEMGVAEAALQDGEKDAMFGDLTFACSDRSSRAHILTPRSYLRDIDSEYLDIFMDLNITVIYH